MADIRRPQISEPPRPPVVPPTDRLPLAITVNLHVRIGGRRVDADVLQAARNVRTAIRLLQAEEETRVTLSEVVEGEAVEAENATTS